MPVRLWASYFDGIGTPLVLVVDECEGSGPPVLDSKIARIATPRFEETVHLAFDHTRYTFGWPARKSFKLSLEPIDRAYPLPNRLDGTSLFGTLAMGLAQSIARVESGCLKHSACSLLPQLRGTSLGRVAVTASCDTKTGQFSPVGCIVDKLHSLCLPDIVGPAVCIIATSQECGDVEQDDSHRLPLLRADDPIDAFVRLWESQSIDVANQLT